MTINIADPKYFDAFIQRWFIKIYQLLQACYENWLGIAAKNQLLEVYSLVKEIWPIYCAFGLYYLMMSVDLNALKSFYTNNSLEGYLREYIAQNRNLH